MVKKPLLVDGNNLFAIGFHGAKGYFHKERHIGGIFHFMNTLRSFLLGNNHDRVIVFWDGENSSSYRKSLYPNYKENRKKSEDIDSESFEYQRIRVKQYMEECFIRQCSVDGNEADDLISYYCKISKDDNITILSGDRDFSQLISEKVSLYLPDKKYYVRNNDAISFKDIDVSHKNILLYKMIVGDKSDNISGIKGFGDKTFMRLCPDAASKTYELEDLFFNAKKILTEKKEKVLENLLNGTNDSGIENNRFYEIVRRVIDLNNPLITEDGKREVESVYFEKINPDDRGYKNLIKLMIDDGFFKFLPSFDDNWVEYLRPFLKLIRKEKRF